MEILGYIASIFMGLSLGMIGGGGSILTVPILVYLFGIAPILATAYSLFIVGSTALFGGLVSLRQGAVDLKTGITFAIPSFIGVYSTRAYLVPRLPDPVFHGESFTISKPLLIMIVFAILMVVASLSMIRSGPPSPSNRVLSPSVRIALIAIEGLLVGGITGFVGAGGGFLIIPALVVLVGLPMKKAVGTSLFIIAAKSLIGFLGDVQQPAVIDWQLLFIVTGIALGGLFLGMRISKNISEGILKKGFGYFVLVIGSLMLIDQIRRL
ncbi:MAG: sulfite exporter TauE/SafE family protein [Bdellovibrio sp.]